MARRRAKAETLTPGGTLNQFLDPAYEYRFTQNPDVVRTKADALQHGLNCVSLAHLALRELFNYQLPEHLCCAELFLDRTHFKPIETARQLQAGDLVWFGIQDPHTPPEAVKLHYSTDGALVNWRDFPVKHVAICTGQRDIATAEPLLLHATQAEGGGTKLWPISKFQQYARYKKIYAVTRLMLNSMDE